MVVRLLWGIFLFPLLSFADYSIVSTGTNNSRGLQRNFLTDFNKDGVTDNLSCHGPKVVIRDGKNNNRMLLNWQLPKPSIHYPNGGASNLHISHCEIARIRGGHPSIVISSGYSNPSVGMRIPAQQYVLYNTGATRPGEIVRLSPQRLRIQLEGRTFFFQSAARGVTCTRFPSKIVAQGYNPGVMCFYAGYDGPITRGGSGTNTALIKLEVGTDGGLIAVDMTSDSGLPWHGGALGTPMHQIPTVNLGWGVRYDGLHMMDGAFMDYNSDGLPDLVTVAQHASIRLGTMRFDASTEEGVSFSNSKILQAGPGTMTEFLRVTAVNELNSNIKEKCLYISGESPNVWDHLRCFTGGQWKVFGLPSNISAGVGTPGINKMSASSPNFHIRVWDTRERKLRFFRVGPRPGRVIGYIARLVNVTSGTRIIGWACQEKVSESIGVHVYVGNSAFQGGKKIHSFTANKTSTSGVIQRCKTQGSFRFDTVIPTNKLGAHLGKKLYLHGIKKRRDGLGGNELIARSGQFSIPKPGRIIGNFDRMRKVSKGVLVSGWVCQKNLARSVDIHIYVGNSAYKGGRKVARFKANQRNGSAVNQRCGAQGAFRFNAVIPKHDLKRHVGKPLFIHGIKIYRNAPGSNEAITRSGQFRVPEI